MTIAQLYQSKLQGFHGSNRGSNPRGDANNKTNHLREFPAKTGTSSIPLLSRSIPSDPTKSAQFSKATGEQLVNFEIRGSV